MDLANRYLRVLGFEQTPCGLDGLRALVRAHVTRVPFENVSKLLLYGRERRARALSLVEFLNGIEHHDLGGTCYSSNPFFADLLRALGYDADLVGADMSEPNVHTSIRVHLEGRDYHVDVGYGAPFYEPMSLDRLPYAIDWGRCRYVLDRAETDDAFVMSHLADGTRKHGYVAHPPPRDMSFFVPIVIGSFEPSRTFMRCVRIARFFDDCSVDVHNRQLTVSRPGSSRDVRLDTPAELRDAMNDLLRMPRCPIERAIAVYERLTGLRFFNAG